MTDLTKTMELLDKYNISYSKTYLYKTDGSNALAGFALWLHNTHGHIEFDLNGKLTNIVDY